MKAYLIILALLLLSFATFFLVGSFLNASIDATKWEEPYRAIIFIIGLAVGGLLSLHYMEKR